MVWGMALPNGFGDFFPEGDFVGWREELTKYYNNEMPAEQRDLFGVPPRASGYRLWVALGLTHQPGTTYGVDEYPPFRRAEAHEAPKRFQTKKRYPSLASFIELTNKIVAIDADLKGIIETFEPGLHQFFPLEIVMPKQVAHQKPYFILEIGQFIDSFLPEQSDSASWRHYSSGKDYFFEDRKNFMVKLALSKQKFNGAHLWRESRMLTDLICFSDELMSAIELSGLRLPKRFRLKEV